MSHHKKPVRLAEAIPRSYLSARKGKSRLDAEKSPCLDISRHPFNSQTDILWMSTAVDQPPSVLEDISGRQIPFWWAEGVDMSTLLRSELFTTLKFRPDSFIALSAPRHVGDDVICLDGSGRLVLNVQKDTYESLGLIGRPSRFGALRQRFVIEIDLRDPKNQSSTGLSRIKQRLRDFPDPHTGDGKHRSFDLLLASVDTEGNPAGLPFPLGTRVQKKMSRLALAHLSPKGIQELASPPTAASAWTDFGALEDDFEKSGPDLLEWLGGLNLAFDGGLHTNESARLEDSKSGTRIRSMSKVSIRGFIHPQIIGKFISDILKHLTPTTSLFITTRNFPHAPIGFRCPRLPSFASEQDETESGQGKSRRGRKKKRGKERGHDDEKGVGDGGETGWNLLLRPGLEIIGESGGRERDPEDEGPKRKRRKEDAQATAGTDVKRIFDFVLLEMRGHNAPPS